MQVLSMLVGKVCTSFYFVVIDYLLSSLTRYVLKGGCWLILTNRKFAKFVSMIYLFIF